MHAAAVDAAAAWHRRRCDGGDFTAATNGLRHCDTARRHARAVSAEGVRSAALAAATAHSGAAQQRQDFAQRRHSLGSDG